MNGRSSSGTLQFFSSEKTTSNPGSCMCAKPKRANLVQLAIYSGEVYHRDVGTEEHWHSKVEESWRERDWLLTATAKCVSDTTSHTTRQNLQQKRSHPASAYWYKEFDCMYENKEQVTMSFLMLANSEPQADVWPRVRR